MSYYDEEMTLSGPDTKNLSMVKVSRLPSGGSGGSGIRQAMQSIRRMERSRQSNSIEDDGLLQDIVDHDEGDGVGEDDDDSDSEAKQPLAQMRRSATQRPQTRQGSTRQLNLPTAKALDIDTDPSETESEEGAVGLATSYATTGDDGANITPAKWEHMEVHKEVKDLFPYILKYTPQTIDTPYHLQPFIPEYVPAVGDVDAFLKVTIPPLPGVAAVPSAQPQRAQEVNEHLHKMGLHILDEPSGEQSEPSLLNMKLRSVLTGSGVNPRSASAALMPTAKAPRDIDKWIAEVEQVHMTQSIYESQPRKDIEPLLLDWPRSYADNAAAVQDAYHRCQQDDIDLAEYVRVLCQRFDVPGPLDTQTDYLLGVQTLFALYLAANQAWE